MDRKHTPITLAKVTGIYRWFDGAHFDADYYRSEHARLTWALLQPMGLLRFEADCAVAGTAPRPGTIVAASNAYFASLAEAQAAVAAAGAKLAADLPRYTDIRPELRLSQAWISEAGGSAQPSPARPQPSA